MRAPPLLFGRRPPQSNYPPDTVPLPGHGEGLGCQNAEGGIPRATPRGLASPLRSLPPILYTTNRQPMSSCSKGSRGLSVLPRVSRICYSYGRRLPGLGFAASLALTAPRDLPAPGRRQTLYVVLRLQQSPVFLINSRLDLFTVADLGSGSKSLHPGRHPFSRSYGVILPSSLTIVLPIALVCSTHPPVSVCGTGSSRLPRGFSRKYGLTHFTQSLRPPPQPSRKAHFTTFQPTWHHGDVQNPAELPFSVTPSVKRRVGGAGMSTCCASATPSGLALAPD